MPRSPRSAVDPQLFVRRAGRWHLRLDALCGPPAPASQLRGLLPESLRALGADVSAGELPDDLVCAAAATGALASLPLLDILDGGGFARSSCLCCYAARSQAAAREAGHQLRAFLRYYSHRRFLESRAFPLAAAVLARDIGPEEAAEVKAHVASLDETSDAVREINSVAGLCVATPACRPGVVWIYSTPAGRLLLRHLARGLRRRGAPVRVVVASSDAACHPRHRCRMYAASLLLAEDSRSRLLDAAVAWCRALRQPGAAEEN